MEHHGTCDRDRGVEEDEREQKEQQKAAEAQKGQANPVCFLDIEAPTPWPWSSLWDGVPFTNLPGNVKVNK